MVSDHIQGVPKKPDALNSEPYLSDKLSDFKI